MMTSDQIFISYSRSDEDFAFELAERLKDAGANIWMDQAGIKPSMHWDNTIEKALEECGSMLVLLSEQSVKSENVKDEYSYALENGKSVYPVLLEDCEIPFRLKRLQYTDFSQDPNTGLQSLLESLKMDQAKSATTLKSNLSKPLTASQKEIKKVRKKSKAAYLALAAVSVVVVLVLVFRNSIFPNTSPGSFTVLVEAATSVEENNIPEDALVVLEAGDVRLEQEINSQMEATFSEVPAELFNDEIGTKLSFMDPDNEPYRSVNPDSAYILQRDGSVTMTVKLFGLDKLSGIVKDFETGDPVDAVRISVNGEEAYSNQNGEFSLALPQEKQKKFQTVRAFHDGYQLFELSDVPVQTGMELPILLKPKTE